VEVWAEGAEGPKNHMLVVVQIFASLKLGWCEHAEVEEGLVPFQKMAVVNSGKNSMDNCCNETSKRRKNVTKLGIDCTLGNGLSAISIFISVGVGG